MGNYLKKNKNTLYEDIIISMKKNIPIIIDGIIDLNYICFMQIDRNYDFKIKSFNEIKTFMCLMSFEDSLSSNNLSKLQKLFKKFDNLVYSFKILNNCKISTYDKLCAFFIFSLREKIQQRLSYQFLEQDKSALNSLLNRIKDIYPEK